MPTGNSFYDVLTRAIADMVEHGFDSAERVNFWTQQIKEAAERTTRSAAQMEQMLRDGLAMIYKRMVEKGQLVQFHKGVARFTLERVRPALRAELDRRIMASANLIKLNREQAIAKTLQRFQGWSTSLPAGGSDVASKAGAKEDIRKSLAGLPFEERRVLIDQGHKLRSSLSDILAKDGAAIAATWHSHWRQTNYDYRIDHKERDGLVYALRGCWALEQGLIKAGPAGYADEITQPAEEPFCRCYFTYIYHLRSVPKDMLTGKGAAALADAKAKVAAFS